MKVLHLIDRKSHNPSSFSPFLDGRVDGCSGIERLVAINENAFSQADAFVIDACYCREIWKDDDFPGIKILKLLRLMGYRQHCIVYSFLPIAFLLGEGYHHEVLLSCGTTYVQLPGFIDEAFVSNRLKRYSEEDMTVFFSAEANELFRMKRHSLANWWGVLRVYSALKSLNLLPESGSQEGVDEALARIRDYRGLLMTYVRFHGNIPKDMTKAYYEKEILEGVKRIKGYGLKTVYIDDRAREGWAYLLQMILYGEERPDLFFVPTIPPGGLNIDEMARKIIEMSPDLVILDIRLVPEDESAEVSQISGIALIRKLVLEHGIASPILAFTASDKSMISSKAFENGVDAVWTKEGMDEGARLSLSEYEKFSAERFRQLVNTVCRFGSPGYNSLYSFMRRVYELRDSECSYWWELERWFPEDLRKRHPVSREVLIKELLSVAVAHKQFLLSSQPEIQSIIYDMLTIKLCRILELLHPWNFGVEKIATLKTVIDDDWPTSSTPYILASELVKKRNTVVHRKPTAQDKAMTPEGYKSLMNQMMDYLMLDTSNLHPFERIVGVLRKGSFDGEPFYSFTSDDRRAFFMDRDFPVCEKLLEGADRINGIEATVAPPYQSYEFVALAPFAKTYDHSLWWDASFSIVNLDKAEVRLFLSKIVPRAKVFFDLEDTYEGELMPESTLYFYIESLDPDKGQPQCRIFEIHDAPPEYLADTFWTGVLDWVEECDGKMRAQFKYFTPPKEAYFVVPRQQWEQKVGKRFGRMGFRPDWVQECAVSDPVKR